MLRIYAYLLNREDGVDEVVAELIHAAEKIDKNAHITAILTGNKNELDSITGKVSPFFDEVWQVKNESFAYPNSELVRQLLCKMVKPGSVVLLSHDHFAMDLAPGLSVHLNSAYLPDIIGIDSVTPETMVVVRQEYSGMVHCHLSCSLADGAVITLRPGVFKGDSLLKRVGSVADRSSYAENLTSKRRFVNVVQAESGDVDIAKSDVLVSIGRGIEDQENIGMAEKLAQAMGADLSCSRPIVDAKWMAKSRQVGTSGKTVKPKVYLALGISGSFQHLGGLKGSPFVVAVNKNPKAPIFQMADVGILADILEFIPEFTEYIEKKE